MNEMMAEEAGFEPAERFDAFTALAMQRIRPLCHPSGTMKIYNIVLNCKRTQSEMNIFS